MKISKIGLLISCLFIEFYPTLLIANKICIADRSIELQKKRYISQGLLISFIKDKMLFDWPVKICQCWISSLYGRRGAGFHYGVDLAATKGTDVFAAADGYIETIEYSVSPRGYGNMILIDHDEPGYKTRYAHLNSISKHLSAGHRIAKGQKIGTVGSTGHVISKYSKSDPSHLHFEIYKGDARVDPLKYLFASEMVLAKNQQLRKGRQTC